jgi:hypothetical protein
MSPIWNVLVGCKQIHSCNIHREFPTSAFTSFKINKHTSTRFSNLWQQQQIDDLSLRAHQNWARPKVVGKIKIRHTTFIFMQGTYCVMLFRCTFVLLSLSSIGEKAVTTLLRQRTQTAGGKALCILNKGSRVIWYPFFEITSDLKWRIYNVSTARPNERSNIWMVVGLLLHGT